MHQANVAVCLASIIGLLAACGKDSKKNSSAPMGATFLNLSDVQPSAIFALDKSDMLDDLEDSKFYDDYDEASTTSADAQKCTDDLIKNTKISAKGDTMEFSIVADIASCFTEAMTSTLGSLELKLSTASFRIGSTVRCEGADFSAYDGKSIIEIGQRADELNVSCDKQAKSYTRMNSQSQIAGSVSFAGVSNEFNQITNSLKATDDGSPCETTKDASGVATLTDGCIEQELTKHITDATQGKATDKQGKEDYLKIAWKGLKSQGKGAVWYMAGSANVTVNDWSGTVTYSSATVPPSYSMSKGSETATGKFKAPSTTSMVGQMNKRMLKSIKDSPTLRLWQNL